MIVALTGGTGFLGGALLDLLSAQGHDVRALARRPQDARDGVTWVMGDLANGEALVQLVAGADVVVHVAGAINAPDRAAFAEANAAGTERLAAAAERAECRRFILVSSLSAREPALSDYGWSKREGEVVLERTALDWTIVRPPAIYGPGDREMLEMFRMAVRGLVLTPPAGRLSMIHVDDMARLLLCLASDASAITSGQLYEPDDGAPGGWSYPDFARALGSAVGRKVRVIAMPRPLMALVARMDRLIRGAGAKLTPDRVRYMCHPDWVADPERAVPPALWSPSIGTAAGLAQTAQAYRAKAWLR